MEPPTAHVLKKLLRELPGEVARAQAGTFAVSVEPPGGGVPMLTEVGNYKPLQPSAGALQRPAFNLNCAREACQSRAER